MDIEPKTTQSDIELLNLLNKASEKKSELRLMRIGGPRKFRYDLFSFSEENNPSETICALQSSDIKSIFVLLVNPNSESFLRRLDAEKSSTWRIWRVMRHILLFAEKLFQVNKTVRIALHKEELIWNLGIVGEDEALITPYGLGTGHDDSAKTQWLNSSNFLGLSTAFFNYFEAIMTRHDTIWLNRETKSSLSNPMWPSLFKGNAVLAKKEDEDGVEEPQISKNEVCKICTTNRSSKAEETWLGLSDRWRKQQNSFRPGKIIRPLKNIRGNGLVLKSYKGPTLFDLSAHLNDYLPYSNVDNEKKNHILFSIYKDTLVALSEFSNLSKDVFPKSNRNTYPYAEKLSSAIKEIKSFFTEIPDHIWNEALADANALGSELEEISTAPFRDAHLKNRIWNDDLTANHIVNKLLNDNEQNISTAIKHKVIDVDFETAHYSVTPYDDPFHILYFEHSILDSSLEEKQKQLLFHEFESIFKLNVDLWFWRTGLARSMREYCRRIWYRNVMPNTFKARYSLESQDYFLRLAFKCSSYSSGYLNLHRLLEALESHAIEKFKRYRFLNSNFFKDAEEMPVFRKNNKSNSDLNEALNPFKVFVSYSHQDEAHRQNLEKCLILLKRSGIIDIWHDRKIFPGSEWDKKIKKELVEADIIIFLVSYDFLASNYITDVEVKESLKQHKAGLSRVVPIIVRDVSLKNTDFSHIQSLPLNAKPVVTWEHKDSAWRNIEEGLRDVIQEMKNNSK